MDPEITDGEMIVMSLLVALWCGVMLAIGPNTDSIKEHVREAVVQGGPTHNRNDFRIDR